jgi:putative transposase
MLFHKLLRQVTKIAHSMFRTVERRLRAWTEPATSSRVGGVATDLVKSKRELILENAFLRQQVIVLKRQVARPRLTAQDRGWLILLASRVRDWKHALLLVKPETLLRWHRERFRLFWRTKSKGQARKPRISAETIMLIKQIAVENRHWGTKRIRGELLKLGIRVNKGTIRHYLWQARRKLPPQHHGQSRTTFLANHANQIWACDFVQTFDVFFRSVFLFFIIEHGSRRVVHVGVTRTPTDAWVAQQIREATPFGEGSRFLICDNDDKYGLQFEHAVAGAGIELIHTPPYSPKANALCERFIGTIRRECLDYMLILSEKHLRQLIHDYCQFFNQARPHQGLKQRIPVPVNLVASPAEGPRNVIALPVLGGLHHDYRWAA